MNSPFRCIDTGTPLTVTRSAFGRIIRADATFLIPLGNHFVIQTVTSPGLWGIDADSDDGYVDEVFADECESLTVMLQALGVAVTP